MKNTLVALLLVLAPAQDSLDKKVTELISKLSDDSIDAREQAVRDLAELGLQAIPVLEKAMGRLEGEGRGRVEEAIKAIRARDTLARTLPPVKPVTLEHRNRPAREALEEIGRQAGIPCEFEGDIGKEAVTVSLKDATFLQAVDAVCAAHGKLVATSQHREMQLGRPPTAKPPGSMHFIEGPVLPFPACHVRQYRVRVNSVGLTKVNTFQGTESSGTLQVDVEWQPGVSPRSCLKFELTELKDDQGRSLLPERKEENDGRGVTLFNRSELESSTQESFEFKYPQPDAAKLSIVRGSIVFAYPKESTTLVFDKPASSKGKSHELHGLKVTLTDYQLRGAEHVITITASGKYAGPADSGRKPSDFEFEGVRLPFSYEDVEPVTESGELLNNSGMSGSSDETSYTMTMTFSSEKAQALKLIRIPCVLLHHTDEVKFELKDIALPK